jgi:hypothetical protein
MGEFKSALKPYNLKAALAADRGEDCLVINAGQDETGRAIPSLKHVSEQVERYLHHARPSTFAATKLYLIGTWNLTPPEVELGTESTEGEIEVSVLLPFSLLHKVQDHGTYIHTN